MQVDCRIELEYDSEEQARIVAESVSLDNGRYAGAEVIGNTLVLTASSPSAPSLLHTLEDLLSCLRVADQVVRGGALGGDALPDLDG